jgi:hypothetical protein
MAPFARMRPARRIAALQGASSQTIQGILFAFAERLHAQGLRVAGVIEVLQCDEPGLCKNLSVRDLLTGVTVPISQRLGSGAASGLSREARAIIWKSITFLRFGESAQTPLDAMDGGSCSRP